MQHIFTIQIPIYHSNIVCLFIRSFLKMNLLISLLFFYCFIFFSGKLKIVKKIKYFVNSAPCLIYFSRLINFQLTIPHWRMSKHLLSFWTLKKSCKYAYFHFNVILYCLPFQNDIKVLIMISCYVDNPEIIEMVVLFRLFWQD